MQIQLPFVTQSYRYNATDDASWLACLLQHLVSNSVWFMSMPLPDDVVEITIKPDAMSIVSEALAYYRGE